MNIGESSAEFRPSAGAVIDSDIERVIHGSPLRAEQQTGFIILFELPEPCIVSDDAGKFS